MMKRPHICRLFRFSLRTMLALMVVFSVWLGVTVNQTQRQKAAVEWVRQMDGCVLYDYEIVLPGSFPLFDPARKPPGPTWLRDLCGIDYFATVEYVAIGRKGLADLSPLATLKGLQAIRVGSRFPDPISCTRIPPGSAQLHARGSRPCEFCPADELDISPLTHLKNLRELCVGCNHVSKADAARLQAALPECKITYMQCE